MTKQKRWIKSVIDTAKTKSPALPWQRGARQKNGQAPRPEPSQTRRVKHA